jgi:hypothetical protein
MTDLPAGGELDRLCAERVLGWTLYHYTKGRPAYFSIIGVDGERITFSWRPGHFQSEFDSAEEAFRGFQPSSNIAHAWQLVERLDTIGWLLSVHNCGGHGYRVEANSCIEFAKDLAVTADTAPHAICLCALKALATPIPGGG